MLRVAVPAGHESQLARKILDDHVETPCALEPIANPGCRLQGTLTKRVVVRCRIFRTQQRLAGRPSSATRLVR